MGMQVRFQDIAMSRSGERCDTLLPSSTPVTRRELLLGTSSAGASILSAACGRAGGRAEQPEQPTKITQPVTLLYWTILGGADGSRMKELSQQYAKEHPLVTIEDIQGVPDFLTKFASSVVTGTAPDVVCIRQIYVPGFAEGNMLFDLLPRELQQVGLKAEDFDPNVWRASEYKGKRYSIPLDIHGYMLFYNASVVAESGLDPNKPPQTWNDWLDWIRQLTRSDRHGGFVSDGGEGLIWTFYHHLRQAGGTLFSDDGKKAAFNSAAGHTALSFMAEVFLRANQPLPQPLLDMFEQRRVASFLNGPWNLNRLGRPDNPVFNDLRVGFAPQLDPARPAWWAQSHQLALPRQDKVDEHKRAVAFDFVRWLVEHTLDWSVAGQLPANRKILNSDEFQKSTHPVIGHLKVWERHLASASFMQLHPRYVDTIPVLIPPLQQGVRNQLAPRAALEQAEQAVNALLSQ